MASVEIKNVGKAFGSVKVIHGVDLRIDDGEFVTLVGPSGCGKSTLLRMIAGLEDVSFGEIRIGGNVVNDLPPKKRNIAMVFQNYALYPHMTVSNNMAFSLKLRRAPELEVSNRLRNVAEILGLTPLLARYPRQLSGGQRQRVAMGRSIVRNPSVFLFDEPLSNLDAKLRVQMRAEIKELHQRLRTTTVYVTHDQIEAMTMADRIVVMRDGVVEQIGAPLELFDRPANQFVAGFIGSPTMNFITGTVAAEGTPRLLADSGGVYPVSEALLGHKGVRAIYGIRPEHLQIVSAANGNHTDALAAEVVVVEPTGSETQVVVRVGSQELVCVFGERVLARPGEKLLIRPSALLAHLFHPETGQRLD